MVVVLAIYSPGGINTPGTVDPGSTEVQIRAEPAPSSTNTLATLQRLNHPRHNHKCIVGYLYGINPNHQRLIPQFLIDLRVTMLDGVIPFTNCGKTCARRTPSDRDLATLRKCTEPTDTPYQDLICGEAVQSSHEGSRAVLSASGCCSPETKRRLGEPVCPVTQAALLEIPLCDGVCNRQPNSILGLNPN
jgi:hypothetical protein